MATEALQEATESNPEYVYRSLHSWVAALLLHRGQIDFARQLLDHVPADVRREHRGFVALAEKLAAMEEARRGRGVFPMSVPSSQHWRKSPHLDFPPQVEGKDLRTWYPARVEAVSEQGVTLIVGKPPDGGSPPTYGRIDLPSMRFDAATLDDARRIFAPGGSSNSLSTVTMVSLRFDRTARRHGKILTCHTSPHRIPCVTCENWRNCRDACLAG